MGGSTPQAPPYPVSFPSEQSYFMSLGTTNQKTTNFPQAASGDDANDTAVADLTGAS
jgi:hypothetical protein